MNDVKAFVIPRSKWLRGQGNLESFLYRPSDGKQCCVGIYLSACGTPLSSLTGHKEAHGPDLPLWMHAGEAIALLELYESNDNRSLSEPEREAEIAEGFAKQGIAVTFTD